MYSITTKVESKFLMKKLYFQKLKLKVTALFGIGGRE